MVGSVTPHTVSPHTVSTQSTHGKPICHYYDLTHLDHRWRAPSWGMHSPLIENLPVIWQLLRAKSAPLLFPADGASVRIVERRLVRLSKALEAHSQAIIELVLQSLTYSRPADWRHHRARHLAWAVLLGHAQKRCRTPSVESPRQIQQLCESPSSWSSSTSRSSVPRIPDFASIDGINLLDIYIVMLIKYINILQRVSDRYRILAVLKNYRRQVEVFKNAGTRTYFSRSLICFDL